MKWLFTNDPKDEELYPPSLWVIVSMRTIGARSFAHRCNYITKLYNLFAYALEIIPCNTVQTVTDLSFLFTASSIKLCP